MAAAKLAVCEIAQSAANAESQSTATATQREGTGAAASQEGSAPDEIGAGEGYEIGAQEGGASPETHKAHKAP